MSAHLVCITGLWASVVLLPRALHICGLSGGTPGVSGMVLSLLVSHREMPASTRAWDFRCAVLDGRLSICCSHAIMRVGIGDMLAYSPVRVEEWCFLTAAS